MQIRPVLMWDAWAVIEKATLCVSHCPSILSVGVVLPRFLNES